VTLDVLLLVDLYRSDETLDRWKIANSPGDGTLSCAMSSAPQQGVINLTIASAAGEAIPV